MSSAKAIKEKTFSLHWGSGVVEEEVQVINQYCRPTLQLLRFDEGDAKGSWLAERSC